MAKLDLRELYKDPKRFVVTAHRGFSGKYPENTLLAFQKAVDIGADIIEFDLRATKDLVPIVLHDATLDRTTDGVGSPNEYTLAEIKKLNASFFIRTPDGTGKRFDKPLYPQLEIPTFEEVLQAMPETIGLNIQVYQTQPRDFLETICKLYDEYDLYNRGYLTMSTFDEAQIVRQINDKIDLCILEKQDAMDEALLVKLKDFGCDIIQPARSCVTPELCKLIRRMEFRANMFGSNTEQDNKKYLSMGMQGILTDFPDVLIATIKKYFSS